MAQLNIHCNQDCNIIGRAMQYATPREVLQAFGKLMRHHFHDQALSPASVEMYANLMASHLPGPNQGAKMSRIHNRREEPVLKK